ncbi:MAG: hypothetical protein LC793_01770 [Thermomicrobia bacterium]|nr:hypothetical protein [Thermomicrobia bacterium]
MPQKEHADYRADCIVAGALGDTPADGTATWSLATLQRAVRRATDRR